MRKELLLEILGDVFFDDEVVGIALQRKSISGNRNRGCRRGKDLQDGSPKADRMP